MKKINGLSQKPHPYQISAYILFSILVLTYFLITFPLSTPAAKIVGGVLEALTCLIILTSGYIVTATDPSDSLLLATLKARAEGNMQIEQGSEYMCSYDRAYVHETSKHCKRCGRCTEGFDHHCKWINNDIGKKNYKSFIVLISSVWFFLLCFLVFGALVTANYVTDPEFLNHEIFLYMNQPERILTGLIILWVIKGLSLLLFALTTNLVLFHLFLIYKGLTTYQYLTLVQERRDNKREMTVAREAMGDKKKTCLDFVIFLGRSRKQQKDKQEGTKKKKQKSSKDQIPNQNPTNSETKKNKKAFVPDNDPEQDPNGQILTSDAYSANREHLKTEEQVLLSSSPNRNARFIVSDPMRKISSDKLMRPGGGESPTNLAPLEDNPSEGCVNELNYETYQIKQHTPKDRRETASTSIEKKKKLFLNLEGLDQLHIRKSAPSNQSAHQQHQYYSFDKSKSQNEVPSLVEADLGETNGNKQDNIKLMSHCDNGKSKFVLKGLESINKIQKNTVQESQDLESQMDRKEEIKTKYQEVSIENL